MSEPTFTPFSDHTIAAQMRQMRSALGNPGSLAQDEKVVVRVGVYAIVLSIQCIAMGMYGEWTVTFPWVGPVRRRVEVFHTTDGLAGFGYNVHLPRVKHKGEKLKAYFTLDPETTPNLVSNIVELLEALVQDLKAMH